MISAIERAVHLYISFETWQALELCRSESIPEEYRIAGAEIARQREVERATNRWTVLEKRS